MGSAGGGRGAPGSAGECRGVPGKNHDLFWVNFYAFSFIFRGAGECRGNRNGSTGQGEPGGARESQEEPGRARRSQEEPRGAPRGP